MDAGSDPQLQALLECGAPTVTLVAKAWDAQVDRVLRCSLHENLTMIADSVRLLKRAGREVVIDAEHFFDGFAANKHYALDCLRAAAGEGADWLVLCDTNGGSMPWQVQEVCEEVCTHQVRHILVAFAVRAQQRHPGDGRNLALHGLGVAGRARLGGA